MTSFEEVRDRFLATVNVGTRTDCPCCGRNAKLYKRHLNAGMARGLIVMYREAGLSWQVCSQTDAREETKLSYWGLIERDPNQRGRRRVTSKGEDWLRGSATVPECAYVFGGSCLGHDGKQITIKQALGNKFDYTELMSF